jgi:hypothetical protein
MSEMGKRLVQAAAEKFAPKGALTDHRPDLYLADHVAISSDSSRALVGWGARSAAPSMRALENYVMGLANGQARIDHASLRIHPEARAVECVLAWVAVTQPVDRATKMARLGPNQYLEPGTKAIWEVRDDGAGQKYLARLAADNLDELLAEKRALQRVANAPAFSTLRSAGTLVLNAGDHVRFFWKGMTRIGRVQRQDANGQWVVEAADERYVVPENAISDIQVKDPTTVQDYHQRIMDYYRDYGMPEDWIRQYEKQYSAK